MSLRHGPILCALALVACPGDDSMGASEAGGSEGTSSDATGTEATSAGTSSATSGSTSGPSTTDGTTAPTTSTSSDGGSTADEATTSTPLDRVTDGQLLLYRFDAGGGTVVADVGGSGAPLNLNVANAENVVWGTNTLTVMTSTRLVGASAPDKVVTACEASDALTAEAWVRAQSQGAGRGVVMTLSTTTEPRAFTVAQVGGQWEFRVNIANMSVDGLPALLVSADVETMSHVVYTREATGTIVVYVDGEQVATDDRNGGFTNWPEGMAFSLASENNNGAGFLGEFGLAAVYCRALTADEVTQNFEAGF